MHDRLSRNLSDWKLVILEVGMFILFLVTFGEFLIRKVWAVISPLLR
jgi:hypothetical protein